MEKLNRDELFSIALHLNLPDLLNFCSTNIKIYNNLCKKDYLWLKLLNRDFNDYQQLVNNPKDLYILLWNLNDLKNQLDLEEDIYTLYSLKTLNLDDRNLTKISSSIRFLNNLKCLYISLNKIKKLSNHFPNSLIELHADHNCLEEFPNNLPDSLQKLFLPDNHLKKIPDNLPNSLELLYLNNNKLKEIPSSLPDSLKSLYVSINKLEKLPNKLPNSLTNLYVLHNNIKELPDRLPDSLVLLQIGYNNLTEKEISKMKNLYPKLLKY